MHRRRQGGLHGLENLQPKLPLWAQNVVAPVHASNNVWEVAGEADVPLLKDFPLAENFDLNLAGRYTDYSTSGSVQTWKIGMNWQVRRLRALARHQLD